MFGWHDLEESYQEAIHMRLEEARMRRLAQQVTRQRESRVRRALALWLRELAWLLDDSVTADKAPRFRPAR